jgi:glycosyltransferase involved in cell wall biosynthesis
MRREGIPERKIHFIPNGLHLDDFPAALMVPPPPPIILTVARFDPVKGHEDLLAAASLVIERRPDARFVWVGAGGEFEPMRRRVRVMGLEAAIELPGETDDVLPFLHRAHLFVLPSHQEGVPGSALEAMAARLPVVATRVGGLPEIVDDGITGRLVPPRDTRALAQAILDLLEDSTRCQSMGEAGRRRVERCFSRETFIKAHEKLYRELMGMETGSCEDVL